jgi:hypothetical protein
MIIDKFSEWKLPDTIVIVAAHDPRWAKHGKFVDRHLLLENGRIRELQ